MQVDLFFYREPEEAKQQEEDEAPPAQDFAIDFNDTGISSFPADRQWPTALDQPWTDDAPQPIPVVPTNWTPETAGTTMNYWIYFGSLLYDDVVLNFNCGDWGWIGSASSYSLFIILKSMSGFEFEIMQSASTFIL